MNIGEKIILDNKQYIVLDISCGSKYKLMALDRVSTRRRMDSSRLYEEKELDLYLSKEFLNTLSFKDKILIAEIDQCIYAKNSAGELNLGKMGIFAQVGAPIGILERKIYTPSLKDFEKLPEEVLEEILSLDSFSLRDAYPKTRKGSWGICGSTKKAEYFYCREYVSTRPVFTIEL